ncbi:LuxR C-terminal-related transcriptional regulator [Nocardioides sp. R1-1]|uniref:LuxR C-terminal-related transcriptional regulator n=1 Tax=Nocardioides sp. R1-1 TaxID=3383502 RepID=UPI0038D11853
MTTVERTSGPLLPPDPRSPRAPAPELPRLPGVLVPRPHLTTRLDRLAAVTVLDTLPGFGGRTFVAAWAHRQRDAGSAVVWLDGIPDEEPTSFRDRLRAALVASGALPSVTGAELEHWLPALARCRRPVVIVVADAPWLLADHRAGRLLEVAQRAHPVHLLLLCSGADGLLEKARDRGIDAQVITSSDLSLRPEETRALAAAWGHPLDDDAARSFAERIGGWTLPLKLALEATPAGSAVPALHAAHDFVLDEVVRRRMDGADLEVAARLAVPRTIDAPLAEALLADTDSAPASAVLAALERRDLLWRQPSTTGRAQWRFPELVRSALTERCADPEALRHAHAVTARILTCRGEADLSALVEHTCAARDPALLADLWSEHGWVLLGTDLATFGRTYDGLDAETEKELAVAAGLAEASRRIGRQSDWLARTEALMRHYAAVGDRFLAEGRRAASPSAYVDLLTAAMVARRSEGRVEEAVGLAAELDRALRSRRTTERRGLASQASWGWVQAAMTHLHAGSPGEAQRLAMAANDAAPGTIIGRGAAALLGLLCTTAGDQAEADRWLAQWDDGDDHDSWGARLAGLPGRLARAMRAMDRLDQDAAREHLAGSSLSSDASGMLPAVAAVHTRYALLFGEPVAMLARLDNLALHAERQLTVRSGLWRQVFDRCTADLLLALGEVDRARGLLGHDAIDVPPWLVPSAARFHLITGDPLTAARVARAGAWQGVTHARDRMELLMLSARGLHAIGRTPEAVEDLRRAHALGGHVDSLEPYVLLGDERATLLATAGLHLGDDQTALLDRVAPVYPASASFVQLTPRERVVLAEMARHETAAAVARSLSVSVNTVKKQMVSIYAKLGVHDRGSALIRAHRLGLVPAPTVTPHPRR